MTLHEAPGSLVERSATQMCNNCQQFAEDVTTDSSKKLQALHRHLFVDGVQSGALVITDGSLQWSDYIECTLECVHCKQQFKLSCETYHGGGGRFGPSL